MPQAQDTLAPAGDSPIVISVDAMGGDKGPVTVVAGLVDSATRNPAVAFILHGDQAVLEPLVARHAILAGRCTPVPAAPAPAGK